MAVTHTITFVVSAEQERRLKEWAVEESRSVSSILREMIEDGLRDRQEKAKAERPE